MNNTQKRVYFSQDTHVEDQDVEVWVDGFLTYTCKNGLEEEYLNGQKSDSPFHEEPLQTVYEFEEGGTIQHNHVDDSFYFVRGDGNIATYVDGEVKTKVDPEWFHSYVSFAQDVLTNKV